MASIRDLQAQLIELESTSDNIRRNELALHLMDQKMPGLTDALVRLIQRPELQNYRGTLVYCLSHFNCRRHVDLLVELVITGNYEVAYHAMDALFPVQLSRVKAQRLLTTLELAQIKKELRDHQREFMEKLREWFE
ncbi:hypothetical protein ACFSM5_04395 [Lacibacterium aquatile]|uniref:HEAT repeat domain-containing protein n=1 Tax=Lacibacterium aquatile TaxID=1168082 RepID=A0ABW5DN02_9PROT